MKIVVLAGGLSTERDVSLASGSMVAAALAEKGHAVVMVDAFMGIEKPAEGLESLFKKLPEFKAEKRDIPSIPPDLSAVRASRVPDNGTFLGDNVLEICKVADVVFIALHGAGGEDGRIQAVFDYMDIPYTGSGFYGCVKAMDKEAAKLIMRENGIPTADWVHVGDIKKINWDAIHALGFPTVVKPTCGGSSVATFIVDNEADLREAVDIAWKVSGNILCEEYFGGREVDCGVLDGKALNPIEIIPVSGWFDYEKKYQPGMTREVCPAEIPAEHAEKLRDAALRVHKALGLGFYSRIDFKILDDGTFTCLEANTLPGFTSASLFPKEAADAGLSYPDLCDMIVRDAAKTKNESK